jgi:hypothetical protein
MRELLLAALQAVEQEAGTKAWFALHDGAERYASFAVFADMGARFAHLTGHLPAELAKHALSLLQGLPDVDMPRVLAAKIG